MLLRLGLIVAMACSLSQAAGPASQPATEPTGDDKPPISLQLDNVSPQEAFERLPREAHLALHVDADNADTFWARHKASAITLDIDQLPYWQALHEVCARAGVTAKDASPREITVCEIAPVAGHPLAIVHGLLQIEPDSLRDTRSLTLSADPLAKDLCRMTLRVRAAPGLMALRCEALELSEVIDQAGKPLKVIRNFPSPLIMSNQALLSFDLDRGNATAIRSIKGQVHLILRGEPHTLEIANICKSGKVERSIGGLQFVVTPTCVEGGCDVEATVTQGGDIVVWEDARRDVAASIPTLEDAKGRRFLAGSMEGSGGLTKLHWIRHYRRFTSHGPDSPGEPDRFIWNFCTTGRVVLLPFEFSDLALQ